MGKKVVIQSEFHIFDDELQYIDASWRLEDIIQRNIYQENGELNFKIVEEEDEDDAEFL